jgi:hypothetical protein
MDFPNDADGNTLRKVAEHSDMSKPMQIDFVVDVPSEADGEEVAKLVAHRGYTPVVEFDEDSQRWTCYCTKHMVPTYEGVLAAQKELDELSAAFGGRSDGWGTSGN